MQPIWILEKDIYHDGSVERMQKIITDLGMQSVMVDPSKGYYGKPLSSLDENALHIPYGSINLIRHLNSQFKPDLSIWMNQHNLSCRKYYSEWGPFCLQRKYIMLPWIELKRRFTEVYLNIFQDENIFIRPNNCFKSFTGKVVGRSEFLEWWEMEQDCYNLDPEMLVVISEFREIDVEYRFIISDHAVITGRDYSGKIDKCMDVHLESALEYAKSIAAHKWQPDVIYTLDVAEFNNNFYVLEMGSVNCSAFYNADLEKIVQEMTAVSTKQYNDLYEHTLCRDFNGVPMPGFLNQLKENKNATID